MKEQYVFGVDLGGTTTKLGLFSQTGKLLKKRESPTDTREKGKHILRNIAASIHEEMQLMQLEPDNVIGAGLGIPGAVVNGRSVRASANLKGWGGFDVAAAFSRLCGMSVKVINDANAAALGELWQGSAKGARNMIFLTIGTGVGGGVVVNGRIVEGAHGAGGEIGHIKVHPEEKRICGCGKRGCLEQFASATGLSYAAKTLLDSTDELSSLRQYQEVTAKQLFTHAKQGDVLAVKLAENFASELGRALSMACCVCDPEVIVLGGGVSAAGTYLLNAVQAAFLTYAYHATEATVFTLASLGNDAGMYGAARSMIE